jgi:hypothetical protein
MKTSARRKPPAEKFTGDPKIRIAGFVFKIFHPPAGPIWKSALPSATHPFAIFRGTNPGYGTE